MGESPLLSAKESEIKSLLSLSARIGCDPSLAQASSGNTSLKRDGILWIKASGKWLADAEQGDILVPLHLKEVRSCLRRNLDMTGTYPTPSGMHLRASVETAMHAVIPCRVVVHVHSVNTIARAVRQDAHLEFSERLEGLPWCWIPYIASGIPLAREIEKVLSRAPNTQIFVLGNHGLVLAGQTCGSVETLLETIETRLATGSRHTAPPQFNQMIPMTRNSIWRLPADDSLHSLGTDPQARQIASSGVLYPCQAIFLGGSAAVVPPSSQPAANSLTQYEGKPFVVVDGCGVLVNDKITNAEQAMLSGFGRVVQRIDPTAPIRYLSELELGELLREDVYKYRDLAVRNGTGCRASA